MLTSRTTWGLLTLLRTVNLSSDALRRVAVNADNLHGMTTPGAPSIAEGPTAEKLNLGDPWSLAVLQVSRVFRRAGLLG